MKIVIEELQDTSDCETCGGGWAEGYLVTIDGNPFGDYKPIASCYGSTTYSFGTVLKDILAHLGHELEIK